MPRIFINLEAGCLQVNLMSTSAQINQLKYTILYYTNHTLLALNPKTQFGLQDPNDNVLEERIE